MALDVSCYDKSSIFIWYFEFSVSDSNKDVPKNGTDYVLNLVAKLLFAFAEAESGP